MPSNVTLAERFKASCQRDEVDLRWPVAWAEDRAPWRHDLIAVPGTKPEDGRQDAALH